VGAHQLIVKYQIDRVYGLAAYQAGFSLMIGCSILAFILLFFTHETRCRQMQQPYFSLIMNRVTCYGLRIARIE